MWKKEAYFLADQDFPLGMDHLVRDAVEQLRPKLKFPSTLEECLVSVDKIEKEAVEKLEQMGLNNDGLGKLSVYQNSISTTYQVLLSIKTRIT